MPGAGELSDALVAKAAEGDSTARNELFAALRPLVCNVTRARLRPTPAQVADIEDLVQRVCSDVDQQLPGLELRTVSGLRRLTLVIIERRVADYVGDRPRGTRPPDLRSLDSTVGGSSTIGPLWAFLPDSGTSPSGGAVRDEQVDNALSTINRLSDAHREIIELAFLKQLSTAEIAERMHITRPAAAMLLIRALTALRDELNGTSVPA